MKRMALAVLALWVVMPCAARQITVDDDGPADFSNIQAAISDANHWDQIIVSPGLYTGPGNYDVNFIGKKIHLRSTDPNDPCIVAATIIDCNADINNQHRGFVFNNAEDGNSVVDGLTVTRGFQTNGGGLYCYNAFPTIVNCVISYCSTGAGGGGVYFFSSGTMYPAVINTTFNDNFANRRGGGIFAYINVIPRIINCTFTNNNAGLSTSQGGAVYLGAGGEISGCTFTGNAANYGGAIYEVLGACNITGSTFQGNSAVQSGGAIRIQGGIAVIRGCAFAGNTAQVEGGGIQLNNSPNCRVINCTFANNVAPNGAAVSCDYSKCTLDFDSSILWDGAGEIWDDVNSAIEVRYSNIFGGWTGAGGDNIDVNPMFVRDPNDGGDGWGAGGNDDFGDLHLQSASPCIDTGNPQITRAIGGVDIDGQPRPMGPAVDIGADEVFAAVLTVTRPAEGDLWVQDSNHYIRWTSDIYDGNVTILLSDDGGSTWSTVASDIPNSGRYFWKVPATVNYTQCYIRVVPYIPDPNVVSVDGGPFIIMPFSSRPPAEGKWKSLGANFKRTGLSAFAGPEIGCTKWLCQVQGPVSAPAAVNFDGRIHFACEAGYLYTLDANGGYLWGRWYIPKSPIVCSPTIGPDGSVYVGDQRGRVMAFDYSGGWRWVFSTDGGIYASPAVSPDGNIYVCCEDGTVWAFGPDGSELWTFRTGDSSPPDSPILASPAIGDDGTIYVTGLHDANLYALHPENGSVKWVHDFGRPDDPCHPVWVLASPVVGPNDVIYQTLMNNTYLYAIDANYGNLLWSVNLAPTCYKGCSAPQCGTYCYDETCRDAVEKYLKYLRGQSSTWGGWFHAELNRTYYFHCRDWYGFLPPEWAKYPFLYRDTGGWSEVVIGPDGTIYAGLDDPYLRAVDPNGNIKWVARLGWRGGFTMAVGSDGLVYAAADDGYLCVVDPAKGEVSRFKSDSPLRYPVIAGDGALIVSDADNRIWAIEDTGCTGRPAVLGRIGDIDRNWNVNFIDFALLGADYGDCPPHPFYPLNCLEEQYFTNEFLTGDLDRNMYGQLADFALLADYWLSQEQ